MEWNGGLFFGRRGVVLSVLIKLNSNKKKNDNLYLFHASNKTRPFSFSKPNFIIITFLQPKFVLAPKATTKSYYYYFWFFIKLICGLKRSHSFCWTSYVFSHLIGMFRRIMLVFAQMTHSLRRDIRTRRISSKIWTRWWDFIVWNGSENYRGLPGIRKKQWFLCVVSKVEVLISHLPLSVINRTGSGAK